MKILFAPFSKPLRGKEGPNPKDYPWPDQLVKLLEHSGHEVVQMGCTGEKQVAKSFLQDLKFEEAKQALLAHDTFISCDSYLQHLASLVGRRGIVLFGPSDPIIFGHSLHINLLKNRDYLRPKQFENWEAWKSNDSAFVSPEAIMSALRSQWN